MAEDGASKQEIVGQLVDAVQGDSGLASKLAVDPAAVVKGVTGLDLSGIDLHEVLAAVTSLVRGDKVDFGNLAELAKNMLAEHGDDLMSMLGSLLGGGSEEGKADDKKPAASKAKADAPKGDDGFGLDDLVDAAGALLGSHDDADDKKAAPSGAKKDDDGFGLDDVLGIAGSLLGKK